MGDKISVDMPKECWEMIFKSLKEFKRSKIYCYILKKIDKDNVDEAIGATKRQLK